MSLNGYMHTPVGFGVYGEQYFPEIVELTEEDLAPVKYNKKMSWLSPSEFSNYNGALAETKGTALGLAAGILIGLAVGKFKEHIEHPILRELIAPAAASSSALAVYWMAS